MEGELAAVQAALAAEAAARSGADEDLAQVSGFDLLAVLCTALIVS